jgi:MraZ protein
MDVIDGVFIRNLDKGRITLPVKLKSNLSDNTIIVTKGTDRCLWLFSPEHWSAMNENILTATEPYSEDRKILQSHILGSSMHLKVSKSGRITMPQPLREYAKLTKKCVLSGNLEYVEIWDADEYTNSQSK